MLFVDNQNITDARVNLALEEHVLRERLAGEDCVLFYVNAPAIIIGRNPPAALVEKVRSRGLAVTLTGFVDDIRPYVAQSDVYVIPLRVGSGTRIKAFEAMAMGRPVVSTTLGIEGLPVTHGEHFLRADTAADVAAAILALLDDATLRTRLAGAARRLMEAKFSWAGVARQFEAICLDALARRRR